MINYFDMESPASLPAPLRRNSAFGPRLLLANPPFNHCDTAPRGCAILQNRANPQVVRKAQDNFRKDDDVRWQWSETTSTAEGSPQGERNRAHRFGSLSRGNANFALPRKHSGFFHHLAPHGMAGFVLVRFWFWVNKRMRTAKSREETGDALVRVQRSVWNVLPGLFASDAYPMKFSL